MKDQLQRYDQLMALNLSETFPDINKNELERLGVHAPTMGEIRLIHHISLGEKIPDNVKDYCLKIANSDRDQFQKYIESWNEFPESSREIMAELTVGTALSFLTLNFHRFREQSDVYTGTVRLAADQLNLAKKLQSGEF